MSKLNILVIGTGMYVCGRGTGNHGTIMPAIIEWEKAADAGEIIIAGRSAAGIRAAKAKIGELIGLTGSDIGIKYVPAGGDDPKGYLKAIDMVEKPACAIIATPDNLHRQMAAAAINAGLHTLVVKPLVPTVREAKALVKIQKEKGVFCAVEFHKRYDQANLKLKEAVEGGSIGDPLYFLAEFSQRKSMPEKVFRRWAATTNIFQYLGIHYADMVYFVTGAKPLRAMASGQSYWLKEKGINTYDAVEAVIEWRMKNGRKFVSHILTNWIDPDKTSAMSDQRIKVIGTKGRYESDQKDRGITVVTDGRGIEQVNPYFCCPFGKAGSVSYRGYGIDSICRFLDDVSSIEDGSATPEGLEGRRPTFEDAVIPTAVLEAVNASLRSGGKWVGIRA